MPYKFPIFVPKIKPNRMATFSYRIRTTRKGILTKVLIRFNVDRHTSFYADTQYLVLSDAWDDKKQTVKSRFTFTDDFTEQQGRELTKNLSELRSHILGEIAKDPEHAMTKTRLEKIIYSFHHPRSLITGRRVRSRESLGDYIVRFTREMEEGTRLNIHKLRYGPSTIKNYKGFVVQFDEYCKARRKQFDFADIDLKFYDDFVAWFTAKNYSVNTIGRHVKELKIIMRAAREEGLHDNGAIESRKFRVLTADVENIYLTESEIRAIAALDLSKTGTRMLPATSSWWGATRHSASATTRPSTKATSAHWRTDSRSSTSSSRRPATTSSFRSGPSCRPSWRSTTTGCREPTNRR